MSRLVAGLLDLPRSRILQSTSRLSTLASPRFSPAALSTRLEKRVISTSPTTVSVLSSFNATQSCHPNHHNPRQILSRINRINRRRYQASTMASATSFYDFKPLDKKGAEKDLSEFKGKVVLVVNTASKCGFTPQYAGLEKLWKDVKEKHPEDFVILGFPCNQFGSQEPGNNDDIQSFCQVNYGVSFPILGKTDVNGDTASPLWQWLKEEQPGLLGLKRVKWNFEKFLIGRDGKVKGRWASTTKPETLEKPILEEINKKA